MIVVSLGIEVVGISVNVVSVGIDVVVMSLVVVSVRLDVVIFVVGISFALVSNEDVTVSDGILCVFVSETEL